MTDVLLVLVLLSTLLAVQRQLNLLKLQRTTADMCAEVVKMCKTVVEINENMLKNQQTFFPMIDAIRRIETNQRRVPE